MTEAAHLVMAPHTEPPPSRYINPNACLDTLPDELILEILNQLAGIGNATDRIYTPLHCKAALSNLASANRRLYRIVIPYLYSNFDGIGDCSDCNRKRGHSLFLRTLITNKNLAENVKTIHLRYNEADKGSFWPPYPLPEPAQKRLYRDLDSKFDLKRIFDICDQPYSISPPKSSGQFLAAMLLLTPNLHSLHVRNDNGDFYGVDGYYPEDRLVWAECLCVAATKRVPPLSTHFDKLRSIRMRMGPMKLDYISPIFQLSSLRTLKLEDVYATYSPGGYHWNCPLRSSPVKELYFDNAYVDSRVIDHVISSIQALYCLRINFGSYLTEQQLDTLHDATEHEHDALTPRLHYPTLLNSVLQHRDSLSTLHISYSPAGEFDYRDLWGQEWIGSLHDLHLVKYLDVGLEAFTDLCVTEHEMLSRPMGFAEHLPPNLERIDLYIDLGVVDHWFRTLGELAILCPTHLSCLKSVNGYYEDERISESIEPHVNGLRQLFRKQSVRFDVYWVPVYMKHVHYAGSEGFKPQLDVDEVVLIQHESSASQNEDPRTETHQ